MVGITYLDTRQIDESAVRLQWWAGNGAVTEEVE